MKTSDPADKPQVEGKVEEGVGVSGQDTRPAAAGGFHYEGPVVVENIGASGKRPAAPGGFQESHLELANQAPPPPRTRVPSYFLNRVCMQSLQAVKLISNFVLELELCRTFSITASILINL